MEVNTERLAVMRNAVKQECFRLDEVKKTKSKERDEYLELKERLETLPRKLKYDIMVPFGSVGFMPGNLVRTNQVMMLLGDGYFAECSCYDACGIIDRRLEIIGKVLKDVDAERKLINEQLSFAERMVEKPSDEVEIREEYNEDTERKFRERRARPKAKSEPTRNNNAKEFSNDADIMKRLDELEALEMENDEMNDNSNEKEDSPESILKPPPGVSQEEFDKLIARLNEDDESSSELESDQDTEEEEDDKIGKPHSASSPEPPKKESSKKKKGVSFAKGDDLEQSTRIRADEPVTAISGQSSSAAESSAESSSCGSSILRNRDMQSPRDEAALAAIKAAESGPRVIPASGDAFTGIVKERSTDRMDPHPAPRPSACKEENSEEPRKISRFRLQRTKR